MFVFLQKLKSKISWKKKKETSQDNHDAKLKRAPVHRIYERNSNRSAMRQFKGLSIHAKLPDDAAEETPPEEEEYFTRISIKHLKKFTTKTQKEL